MDACRYSERYVDIARCSQDIRTRINSSTVCCFFDSLNVIGYLTMTMSLGIVVCDRERIFVDSRFAIGLARCFSWRTCSTCTLLPYLFRWVEFWFDIIIECVGQLCRSWNVLHSLGNAYLTYELLLSIVWQISIFWSFFIQSFWLRVMAIEVSNQYI